MGSKLVPWASWQEWEEVRLQLLGLGPASRQRQGINMVKAWRVRGKVPLSLDVTACLVEAQLVDEQLANCGPMGVAGVPPVSQVMLRNMYSLPIIRLVNGIADAQQRGRTASSVASLAYTAGLPAMLVDIRHAATHGDLPTLAQLRTACQAALAWLAAAYWDTQLSNLEAGHSRLTQNLCTLIASWQAAHTKSVSEAAASEDEEEEEAAEPQASGVSYKSAEGKQLRRSLLSDLRSLVPPSWSCVLLHPLLSALTQHTPSAPGASSGLPPAPQLGDAAGQVPQKKRKREKSGAADEATPSSCLPSKALNSCLLQVLKAYPHLGHQLAVTCLYSLCATTCSSSAQAAHREGTQDAARQRAQSHKLAGLLAGLVWWPATVLGRAGSTTCGTLPQGAASPAAHITAEQAWRWLQLLLPVQPSAKVPKDKAAQHSSGSAGSGDGLGHRRSHGLSVECPLAPVSPAPVPGIPLELSGAQLVDLMHLALVGVSCTGSSSTADSPAGPGLSGRSEDVDEQAGRQDSGTRSKHDAAVARQALDWVVARLSALLQHQLIANMSNAGWGPGGRSRAEALSRLTALTAPPAQLPAQTSKKAVPPGDQDARLSLEEAAASLARLMQQQEQGAGSSERKRSRWQRATHWLPCAIGCLPSACTPSGITPWLSGLVEAAPDYGVLEAAPEDAVAHADSRLDIADVPHVLEHHMYLHHEGVHAADMLGDDETDAAAPSDALGCRVGAAWLTQEQLQLASEQVGFL